MSDLQTTADLIADVLFRAGEPTDATSQFAATALAYLNRAYLGLAAGGGELVPEMREEWRWLKNTAPGVINLLPAIAPGIGTAPTSVNATFNSPAISFAGIFADLLGWEIKIGDNPDIFRVAVHTPGLRAGDPGRRLEWPQRHLWVCGRQTRLCPGQ